MATSFISGKVIYPFQAGIVYKACHIVMSSLEFLLIGNYLTKLHASC